MESACPYAGEKQKRGARPTRASQGPRLKHCCAKIDGKVNSVSEDKKESSASMQRGGGRPCLLARKEKPTDAVSASKGVGGTTVSDGRSRGASR